MRLNCASVIGRSIVFFTSFLLLVSCHGRDKNSKNNRIVVFHAGSLTIPIHAMADAFEKVHPDITVELEASGSVTCVRKITDLNRNCDVLALADARLIDDWMIPDYASWTAEFASNEICLVYSDASLYADSISSDNWFEIIAKEDVRYGRSDPNADPCGYRTILSLKLAENYYSNRVDVEKLLEKDNRFIRPKASDLLALLETKTVDYIFEYFSVATQHGLKCIRLPGEINLGDPEFADQYGQKSVVIIGPDPGTTISIVGSPMVYGLTIPKNSENPGAADLFIRFILAPEGGIKIMKDLGQLIIPLSFSEKSKNYPEILGS